MNDLTSSESWKATIAEFLATFTFVFVGVGAIGASLNLTGQPQTLLYIAIAHGIGIGLGVFTIGRISGGHINPAVTLGAVISGRQGVVKGLMYIVAQLLGATLASLALHKFAFPVSNLGVHALGNGVSPASGLMIEVILTFFLVFTVFATAFDKRANAVFAPFAIGLVIMVDHLVALPLTGASMNPARSFGPALVNGAWANHWVYWAGPFIGAVIAAVAYTYLFGDKEDVEKLGKVTL